MSKAKFVTLQNKSGRTKAITLGKETYQLPADGLHSFHAEVAEKFIERMGKEVETISFNLIDPSITLAEIHTPGTKWIANNTGNPFCNQFTVREVEDKVTKKVAYVDVKVPYTTFQSFTRVIRPNETHQEDYRNGTQIHWARNDGAREILRLAPLTVRPVSARMGQSALNSAAQNSFGDFSQVVEMNALYDARGNKTFVPEFDTWSYSDLRNYLYLCLDDPMGTEAKFLGPTAKQYASWKSFEKSDADLKRHAAKVDLWVNLYFKIISKGTRLPTEEEFRAFTAADEEEVDASPLARELNDQEQSI